MKDAEAWAQNRKGEQHSTVEMERHLRWAEHWALLGGIKLDRAKITAIKTTAYKNGYAEAVKEATAAARLGSFFNMQVERLRAQKYAALGDFEVAAADLQEIEQAYKEGLVEKSLQEAESFAKAGLMPLASAELRRARSLSREAGIESATASRIATIRETAIKTANLPPLPTPLDATANAAASQARFIALLMRLKATHDEEDMRALFEELARTHDQSAEEIEKEFQEASSNGRDLAALGADYDMSGDSAGLLAKVAAEVHSYDMPAAAEVRPEEEAEVK